MFLVRGSLLLLGMFGLGLLFLPESWKLKIPLGQRLFTAGVLGLCVSHALVHAGLSIPLSLLVTQGLGLAGWILYFYFSRRQSGAIGDPWRIVGLIVIASLPLYQIFAEPIVGWDARSIWFFHAKIIYFFQSLLTPVWMKPALEFSHTDYPKLIPILGAQAATAAGFWNDYVPKGGLLLLLLLVLSGFYAFPFRNRITLGSCFLLIPTLGNFMWNGYADGYLAAFTFLATIYLGLFFEDPSRPALWSALAAITLMMQTKNEGLAIGGILLLCSLALLLRRGALSEVRRAWDWRMILLFLPVMIWQGLKFSMHLKSEQVGKFGESVASLRFFSGEFWRSFSFYFFIYSPLLYAIPVFVLYWIFRKNKRFSAGTQLALVGFVLYSLAILGIILGHHWELVEILRTTMRRVTLPLVSFIIAAMVLSEPAPQIK